MNDATKRATSEALVHMLAVTAMLVIASVLFYVTVKRFRTKLIPVRCPRSRVKTRSESPCSEALEVVTANTTRQSH